MKTAQCSRRILLLSCAFLGLGSASLSHASLVSISFAFTKYIGPAAVNYDINGNGSDFYTAKVDDQIVHVSTPDPLHPGYPNFGVGSLALPGSSNTVKFQNFFTRPTTDPISADLENDITFVPTTNADVQLGQIFTLGTFKITNGSYWGNAGNALFDFTLTTHSSDAALDGHSFAGSIEYTSTFFDPNPELSADIFFVSTATYLGTFKVYEADGGVHDNHGTVDLNGKIDSLILTSFANPTGGAFLDRTIPISQPPVIPSVPETSTTALLLMLALAPLAALSRRTLRAQI